MAVAASAQLAATGNNYRGDANLGGGTFGAFELNTKPLEDLARYTMLYNRAEYDQRQKDVEATAREIANVTSIDLTSGIPKDAKLLQEKYDTLQNYIRANPGATNYRNKAEWQKYNELKNDLANDLTGAKVRNLMYKTRQEEIAKETDPALKKLMTDELEQEVEAKNIRTPILHTQEYKDPTVNLPDAPSISFDVTKVGPNAVVEREYNVFNIPKARANGDVFALGLDQQIDPNTPEGKRQMIANKNNFWLRGTEAVNAAINAQDAQGNFLYKTKVTDAQGNVTYVLDQSKLGKMPRSILSIAEDYNTYVKGMRADIQAGSLKDKFERPLTFGPGALDEADYQEINFNDGISPEELGLIGQYAKWKGDTYKTDVKQTDNALQASAQAETARHNKATEGIGWANVNLEKEKWKAATTGGEQVKNGAILFAERIYDDLKKLADSNGVISPDKVRQLNTEQLKYLGLEKLVSNEEGTSAPKSVYSPLSVTDTDAIQLNNGEIRVMTKATKLANGAYSGTWDQNRSTNVSNIATNRLNEQLRSAGAKELNSYLPLDTWQKEISVNTVGGGTTVSGSTTDEASASAKNQNTVPVYRKADLKAAGWSDAQIKQATSAGKIKVN